MHRPAASFADIPHDGIPVSIAVGQRDKNIENRRSERRVGFRKVPGCPRAFVHAHSNYILIRYIVTRYSREPPAQVVKQYLLRVLTGRSNLVQEGDSRTINHF